MTLWAVPNPSHLSTTPPPPWVPTSVSRGPKPKHSQQPPGVVQNWSALQCSEKNTEQCGYDHAPVTRGRMRAQYPLPHGPWVLVVVHLGVVEYARTQVRVMVQGSFIVNSETTVLQGSFTVSSETTLHSNTCAHTSRSRWSTFLTTRARSLVFHNLATNILPNMSKNYQFGGAR